MQWTMLLRPSGAHLRVLVTGQSSLGRSRQHRACVWNRQSGDVCALVPIFTLSSGNPWEPLGLFLPFHSEPLLRTFLLASCVPLVCQDPRTFSPNSPGPHRSGGPRPMGGFLGRLEAELLGAGLGELNQIKGCRTAP